LGDPGLPLADAVRALVLRETGRSVTGNVTLLTHLRYFGVSMNPVSFYFCWNPGGDHLEALVLEVTNTPWGEQHQYVIDYGASGRTQGVHRFRKAFHVSPFLPMDMDYRIQCAAPGEHLAVHLENWQNGAKVFDATLAMERREATRISACWMLLRHPLMTLRVLQGIYYQAFRLWHKGVPPLPHPAADPRQGI
jgi:DUF1365 family protein